MSKTKSAKPEFYRSFMAEDFFPNANKITRFEESENYWIFKTGATVYKVKKKSSLHSAVSLEEIFCNEITQLLKIHSPDLDARLLTVKKENEQFVIDWDGILPEKPLYFLISMKQLTDKGFLSNIIAKKKLNAKIIGQICDHLVAFHKKTKISQSKDDGTPDALKSDLEYLIYQSKKFMGTTITQAIIDMTYRPLEKYLVDNRKIFLRRYKQERVRRVQGCLIPRKIHVTRNGVNFLGKTTDPLKNKFKDVAADIADLTVELHETDQSELVEQFVDNYCQQTDDRELKQVLPVYQALKCLHLGLKYSIQAKQPGLKCPDSIKKRAIQYYEQTIDVTREL